MPMPGASPTGQLAYRPMTRQASAEARQVATKLAPWSMPAAAIICGLTKMM